jgi:regulator of nonsense transcripts 1
MAQNVLQFRPILVNKQIDPAVVKSPSDEEVACDEEKLTALRHENSSTRPLSRELVQIPLEFENFQQFVEILTPFVIEEASDGKNKTNWHKFTAMNVNWNGSKEFRFSSKQQGMRGLNPGMEIILKDTNVRGFICSKSKRGNVTIVLDKDFRRRPNKVVFNAHFSDIQFQRQHNALREIAKVDDFWQRILIGDLRKCDVKLKHHVDAPSWLNSSQTQAVEHALNHRFTVIQGPPGTGKSTCAAAQAIVQEDAGLQVLVVARTNEGANNLMYKIINSVEDDEFPVLRVAGLTYQHGEIPSEILKRCSHFDVDQFSRAKQRREQKKIRDHSVIVTTTCCAGGARFKGKRFDSIIVDEANQLLDPELAILLKFNPSIITLYGDHVQIGPFVESMRAKKYGYSKSLIQRLPELVQKENRIYESGNYTHFILKEQYRMHPGLAEFPSHEFYGGQINSSWAPESQNQFDIPFPNRDHPLVFINVSFGCEQKSSNGNGILNLSEALMVSDILSNLYDAGVESTDITVITFYVDALEVAEDLIPRLPNIDDDWIQNIEFQTVDAYVGKEQDYVILMCVRSNQTGQLGFLEDRGRMNVALTRAKHGLFVVGNRDTLKSQPEGSWAHFVEYCENKRLVVQRWPPQ